MRNLSMPKNSKNLKYTIFFIVLSKYTIIFYAIFSYLFIYIAAMTCKILITLHEYIIIDFIK